MTEWHQERPSWCPHADCAFLCRAQDATCIGMLPAPLPHAGDWNTHRWCLNGIAEDGGVLSLQTNTNDLDWFRWLFDAVDDRVTSWLSVRAYETRQQEHETP